MEGGESQPADKKYSFCFSAFATGQEKNVLAGGEALNRRGIPNGMATGETRKRAARKTPQPAKAAHKAGTSRAGKQPAPRKTASPQREGAAPARKRTVRKLDRKKLSAMVDKMLMQLAERVEQGDCRITTSEGMKLIQLREALGLERPSKVKVEWVEPKAE
ncbi:MAG: hypothetical protein KatS3mg004_0444 [Bryobacteraceae bacterium]|nr:MAG: hypothetical protein KatS3mg004_0444 [Bryobacteraceae bacterium]